MKIAILFASIGLLSTGALSAAVSSTDDGFSVSTIHTHQSIEEVQTFQTVSYEAATAPEAFTFGDVDTLTLEIGIRPSDSKGIVSQEDIVAIKSDYATPDDLKLPDSAYVFRFERFSFAEKVRF